MDKTITPVFPKEYFKKGNEGFEVYSEVWDLIKKYENFTGSDEDWENFVEDIDVVYKKFDGCEMVRRLLNGVVTFFENTWKEKNKEKTA